LKGSKHDFSKGAKDAQLCLPCHVPHEATPVEEAPLWARSADLSKRYVLTGQEGLKRIGSASLVCLSCHDGSMAADTFGGATGDITVSNRRALIGQGGDLSTDHPISVDYPKAVKDFVSETEVLAGGTIKLPGGKVECLSCHDVHNHSGIAYMRVQDNKGSNLCLGCHKK
jgi:predicted CXXCH cytochrome family protein